MFLLCLCILLYFLLPLVNLFGGFFHQLFGVLQKLRFIIFWQFKVVSRVVRHEVGCVSEDFLLPLVTCVLKQ